MSYQKVRFLLMVFVLSTLPICQGCGGKTHPDGNKDILETYVLPVVHPDNDNSLKRQFFQERFVDLTGKNIQLDSLRGTPLVIVMFPSFRTADGRTSLVGLEALQKERVDQFKTVFIPIENAEEIRPTIMLDPEGMLFLFRANGSDNTTLIDTYSDLFWDSDIIAVDYPLDDPEKHITSPFYWVVDRSGTIREKLIDYSNERTVEMTEIDQVLEALLGPPVVRSEPEFPLSIADTEEKAVSETSEETAGVSEEESPE